MVVLAQINIVVERGDLGRLAPRVHASLNRSLELSAGATTCHDSGLRALQKTEIFKSDNRSR